MANSDSPYGLRPVRKAGAAYVTGGGNLYHVAAADAQRIAPGDPVVVTGEADAFGTPTVTRVAAGLTNRITGVMLGIANGEAQLNGIGGINFDTPLDTVASTSQYILVEDDPGVTYSAQYAGTLAAGDIQGTANVVEGAAEEGKSTFEIGASGVDATSQVRILRLVRLPDNELGEFAKIEVLINLPTNINDQVGV